MTTLLLEDKVLPRSKKYGREPERITRLMECACSSGGCCSCPLEEISSPKTFRILWPFRSGEN
jgi:hypothetical protein